MPPDCRPVKIITPAAKLKIMMAEANKITSRVSPMIAAVRIGRTISAANSAIIHPRKAKTRLWRIP